MATYAAVFDARPQESYDRAQVFLRLVIVIVLAFLNNVINVVLYLGTPVVAAVLISQRGAQRYLDESEKNITGWLRIVVGFYSYMFFLTDKLPEGTSPAQASVRYEVTPRGTPSAGNALLRIILIIPHAILLWLLTIVAVILAIISAVIVLIQRDVPGGIYGFQRGYMRWYARVMTYMASLTDEYPPFSLDTGEEAGALPPPASAMPQA